MRSINLSSGHSKIIIKEQLYKLNMLKAVQIYFYFIIIEQFLLLNRIYCAESFEITEVECSIKNLMLEKNDKESDNEDKKIKDCNKTDKVQVIKNLKKDTIPNPIINPSSLSIETVVSISKINSLEDKIFNLNFKLKAILKKTVPDLFKAFNKVTELHLTIKNEVKKIEIKTKNNSSTFFKKIKDTVQKRQKAYFTFNGLLNEIKKAIENLLYILMITYNEYQKVKTLFTSGDMSVIDKFDDSTLSKIVYDEGKLSECLDSVRKTCNNDKKQADTILMILYKILVMTPEEFKNDEEVSKAILSLK